MEHNWPKKDEHLWCEWMALKGLPKPMQYRKCVHPNCHAYEEREWPQ
jgi:hypothetical protein